MSNNLPESKQIAVLSALVEGVSIRATSRMTDVSQPTILSLLVRMGEGCAALHDGMMRGLTCAGSASHADGRSAEAPGTPIPEQATVATERESGADHGVPCLVF